MSAASKEERRRPRLSGTAKRRVLVIDDDIELLTFVGMILEGHGYLAFLAIGAGEGLDLFDLVGPELVVMDATLGSADSLDVCRAMTMREPDTSVVMLADSPPNAVDWQLAADAGVTDIIEKPFDIDELLGRLARAMGPREDQPLM